MGKWCSYSSGLKSLGMVEIRMSKYFLGSGLWGLLLVLFCPLVYVCLV